jgi:hypothetical protein
VHVAAADPAGHDADEHVARSHLGRGEVLNLELPVGFENEGFHGVMSYHFTA